MCYCNGDDISILTDIVRDQVPDDALLRSCCWSRLSQVRGYALGIVTTDIWTELCRRRGKLMSESTS